MSENRVKTCARSYSTQVDQHDLQFSTEPSQWYLSMIRSLWLRIPVNLEHRVTVRSELCWKIVLDKNIWLPAQNRRIISLVCVRWTGETQWTPKEAFDVPSFPTRVLKLPAATTMSEPLLLRTTVASSLSNFSCVSMLPSAGAYVDTTSKLPLTQLLFRILSDSWSLMVHKRLLIRIQYETTASALPQPGLLRLLRCPGNILTRY